MGLFDTISAFTKTLEDSDPPERGIKHVTLRQLVIELGRVLKLISCLDDADEDSAKAELMNRRVRTQAIVRQLDGLLCASGIPQNDVLAEAVRTRFREQLDRILTASVVRLPTELHQHSIEARLIRERYETYRFAWTTARDRTLELIHQLRGSVASLGFAYEQRNAMGGHASKCDTLLSELRTCINTLDTTESRCKCEQSALESLHEKATTLANQARAVVGSLNALIASTRTLDVSIPHDVTEQLRETKDRLESVLENMRDDFADLPQIVRDPTLVDAIQEVVILTSRKEQVLNPIRPSVFIHPLDRSEEVRRLALIALSFCTDRADPFNRDERHRGLGKYTVPDILIGTDLIDLTERTTAADAIFLMHKSGEGLIEQRQQGRFWKYRTTDLGNERAGEWSKECLDISGLIDQIDKARIERNRVIREQRSAKGAE